MKIKLRTRKKIKLETILLHLAVFCVVTFALIEDASIHIPVVSMIKMPLMYIGGVCILPQLPKLLPLWRKKRYFYLLLTLLVICGLLIFSAYYNRATRIGNPPMRTTIRLVLYLLELFFLMMWLAERGSSQFFLKYLFRYVLILTLATDALLFTGIMQSWAGSEHAFLVGTKFTVSYFHMNLLTLWFVQKRQQLVSDRKAKRIIWLGVPLVTLVSVYINCITGIVGCLVLLVLFLLMNTKVQNTLMRLSSPVLLLLCLAVSLLFPFVADGITSLPVVRHVLTTVFGRDASLTGRLNIFEIFGAEMQGHWQWGFGFGNGNAASVRLWGYANAQNALLNWILQVGIPITVLLVLLMVIIFRQIGKMSDKRPCMPFVVLLYVYIILGSVEITFSMTFLLWLAIIVLLINEKPHERIGKSV